MKHTIYKKKHWYIVLPRRCNKSTFSTNIINRITTLWDKMAIDDIRQHERGINFKRIWILLLRRAHCYTICFSPTLMPSPCVAIPQYVLWKSYGICTNYYWFRNMKYQLGTIALKSFKWAYLIQCIYSICFSALVISVVNSTLIITYYLNILMISFRFSLEMTAIAFPV